MKQGWQGVLCSWVGSGSMLHVSLEAAFNVGPWEFLLAAVVSPCGISSQKYCNGFLTRFGDCTEGGFFRLQ